MYGPAARDQRLESFAQGGWGDRAAFGAGGRAAGWLAMQAGDISRPEVLGQATGDEVLGVGRAWKSLETWCFNGKLAVVRELIRRYPLNESGEPGGAGDGLPGGLPGEWDPRLHHEVAAALGISIVAAGKLVNLAWTLDARLRRIGAALEELRLDPGRVTMIVDETAVLDREDLFAKAEELILAGLPNCRTWADLARLVQRAVITVDPDGARKRREQAEREHARIRFWREQAGTCALRGTGLPTDEALAATANIEARALEYHAVPIKRPMDILRVMSYLDLINGVPVAQRAAWAQAEDEARQAEIAEKAAAGEPAAREADLREAARRAREKAREKIRRRNFNPASPGHDEDPGGNPDSGDDGDPGGAGPGGSGPGGADGGESPSADGSSPGSTGAADQPVRSRPCPECGGAGRGIGLPVRTNLTIPVGALDWLAGWSRQQARGTGGGGGGPGSARLRNSDLASGDSGRDGPGSSYQGGPGPCPACGRQGSDRVPVRKDLAVPLLTLLGLTQRPGEAHGLGALDPALVRDLTATGARHPRSEFCVTVVDEQGHAIGHGCCKPTRGKAAKGSAVDPGSARSRPGVTFTWSGRASPEGGYGSWILTLPGAPAPFTVDIDVVPVHECDHRHAAAGYQPGGRLRHLVQVRDGTCSFPACSRRARDSDFEHAIPYGKGGPTCACNAHACSRSCHRVKQSPGWNVTKPRPGWTQWTTMTGRTYSQGPWRYPA